MTLRVSDAETQLGSGLIEEVIDVAEGELKLVDTMLESRVCVLNTNARPARDAMLIVNTVGKSSRRSPSQANGITSLGTHIHQGRKSRRTNRRTYRSS